MPRSDLPVLTPRDVAILAAICLVVLLVALFVRAARHRARLRRIPIRIHVAGVRGKSSVVRLVAAGLRGEGRTVVAKTTGTDPTLVDVDGTERPWRRTGSASVHEQRRFVREAVRRGANAVVIESMAIRGEYLWASEHLLVRATDTIVTNVRSDHQEVFGDDERAVARALAEVVPVGGRLWLGEGAGPELRERARELDSEVHEVPTAGLPPLAANQRLAEAVCGALGIAPTVARARMAALPPAPSEFSLTPCGLGGGRFVRFANAFACNDVTSLDLLFREVQPHGTNERDVVFLNARADRPLRTRTFLRYLDRHHPRARVFVTHPRLVPTPALRRAAGSAPLTVVRPRHPRALLDALIAAAGDGGHVWGIGNHQGMGARLAGLVREEAPCSPPR